MRYSPPLITQISLAAFRFNVFGDFFPNTYYLKVVGVPASERIASGISLALEFSMSYVGLLVATFLALIVAVRLNQPQGFRRFLEFSILIGTSLLLYSLYVGGDFAETEGGPNRFLLPGVPLLLIAVWISLESWLKKSSLVVAAMILFLLLYGPAYWMWMKRNAPMVISDLDRARLGIYIKKALATNLSFAGHAAGNTPYWSDRKFYDLLGKTDAYIAKSMPARAFAPGHNKWDYAYSIRVLKPDLIIDPFRGTTFFGDLSYEIRQTNEYVNIRPSIWVSKSAKGINVGILNTIPQFRSIAID